MLVAVVGGVFCVVEPLVKLVDIESSVEVDTLEPGNVDCSTLESELDIVLVTVVGKGFVVIESLVELVNVVLVVAIGALELVELAGTVFDSEPDDVVGTADVIEVKAVESVEVDCSELMLEADDVLDSAVDEMPGAPEPSRLVELKDVESVVEVIELESID